MSKYLNQTERWLMSELFKLSRDVSSFAVRALGADIERPGPPNTKEEFQLGSRLVELGKMVCRKAEDRKDKAPVLLMAHTHVLLTLGVHRPGMELGLCMTCGTPWPCATALQAIESIKALSVD